MKYNSTSIVLDAIATVTCQERLPDSSIERETELSDLGVTSLLLFKLLTEIENMTSVEISDEDFDAKNFITVGMTCDMLDRCLNFGET